MPLRAEIQVPGVRSASSFRSMQVDYARLGDEMERIQPWLRNGSGSEACPGASGAGTRRIRDLCDGAPPPHRGGRRRAVVGPRGPCERNSLAAPLTVVRARRRGDCVRVASRLPLGMLLGARTFRADAPRCCSTRCPRFLPPFLLAARVVLPSSPGRAVHLAGADWSRDHRLHADRHGAGRARGAGHSIRLIEEAGRLRRRPGKSAMRNRAARSRGLRSSRCAAVFALRCRTRHPHVPAIRAVSGGCLFAGSARSTIPARQRCSAMPLIAVALALLAVERRSARRRSFPCWPAQRGTAGAQARPRPLVGHGGLLVAAAASVLPIVGLTWSALRGNGLWAGG